MAQDIGPYGKMVIIPENGEVPIRKGILNFPSSPDEKPQLIASQCTECGDLAFPPKAMCGKCESETVREYFLSHTGEIYTFTVVHQQGVPGIEVPYILVVVKFPDDKELMVVGQLVDCKPKEVKIGMAVETIIGKVRDGILGMMWGERREIIGYKFRPLKK